MTFFISHFSSLEYFEGFQASVQILNTEIGRASMLGLRLHGLERPHRAPGGVPGVGPRGEW